MATKEKEHYWRLYLYLNNGVSVLSRDIIVRKLDVLGQDLSSFLRKNEGKIRRNSSINDLDVLFPVDGETNMLKWNANLYLCVILAIFRDSLKPRERTKLGLLQNVLQDLLDMQDDTRLDNETYDEHVQNIEEAFLVLTFNEDLTMKIVEMKKVYIEQPLDSSRLLWETAIMDFPSGFKEKLVDFLISSTNAIRGSVSEKFESSKDLDNAVMSLYERCPTQLDAGASNRDAANSSDGIGPVPNSAEKKDLHDEIDNAVMSLYERCPTHLGAGASNRDAANSSDGIGPVPNSAEKKDLLDEIVRRATKPQTEEERESILQQWQQWQKTDIESSHKQQDFGKIVREKLEKWRQEPVNIAVIGRAGVGKSRFVNAIRGCKSKDHPLYADVGTTETTLEVKSYPHPNNPLLKFWDLPGIGTKKFPRKDFITNKKIDFYSYDIYLIVCADRFMEEEEEFAEKIEKSGRTFLFVRTKADANEDEIEDFELELRKIRKNCVENLRSTKIKEKDVYLISSKFVDHKLLDFGKLVERLVHCLPELKKEVVLNSLQYITKTLLKDKQAFLKKRVIARSFTSALECLNPVNKVDCRVISNELINFRHDLRITGEDLENLAQKTGIAANVLKTKYSLKSFTLDMGKNADLISSFAFEILTSIAISEDDDSKANLLPLIVKTAGIGFSCYTTYRFLSAALDIMIQDSEKMLDILLEKTGKSI